MYPRTAIYAISKPLLSLDVLVAMKENGYQAEKYGTDAGRGIEDCPKGKPCPAD
jgi:hypothetical protein